jgi:hypothetical protein
MSEWKDFGQLIGIGLTIAGSVFYAVKQFARLEFKVDTLWDFVMRRALTEGVARGLINFNSPVKISDPDIRARYAPIAQELKAFYRRAGRNMSDTDLFREISVRWGDWILKNICIQYGLVAGSCITIAVALAMEPDESE